MVITFLNLTVGSYNEQFVKLLGKSKKQRHLQFSKSFQNHKKTRTEPNINIPMVDSILRDPNDYFVSKIKEEKRKKDGIFFTNFSLDTELKLLLKRAMVDKNNFELLKTMTKRKIQEKNITEPIEIQKTFQTFLHNFPNLNKNEMLYKFPINSHIRSGVPQDHKNNQTSNKKRSCSVPNKNEKNDLHKKEKLEKKVAFINRHIEQFLKLKMNLKSSKKMLRNIVGEKVNSRTGLLAFQEKKKNEKKSENEEFASASILRSQKKQRTAVMFKQPQSPTKSFQKLGFGIPASQTYIQKAKKNGFSKKSIIQNLKLSNSTAHFMAILQASEKVKNCFVREEEIMQKIEEIKVRKYQCQEIIKDNLQSMIDELDTYGPQVVWVLQKMEEYGPKIGPKIFKKNKNFLTQEEIKFYLEIAELEIKYARKKYKALTRSESTKLLEFQQKKSDFEQYYKNVLIDNRSSIYGQRHAFIIQQTNFGNKRNNRRFKNFGSIGDFRKIENFKVTKSESVSLYKQDIERVKREFIIALWHRLDDVRDSFKSNDMEVVLNRVEQFTRIAFQREDIKRYLGDADFYRYRTLVIDTDR